LTKTKLGSVNKTFIKVIQWKKSSQDLSWYHWRLFHTF